MSVQRRVVCAAIIAHDGEIVIGARHYDNVMHAQIKARRKPDKFYNLSGLAQGFIDQHGVFMDRIEAHGVAEEAGQILYRCGGDEYQLYSENLY